MFRLIESIIDAADEGRIKFYDVGGRQTKIVKTCSCQRIFPLRFQIFSRSLATEVNSRGSLTNCNFSVKMALVNFSRVALTKLTNKSCLGAVGSVRNHWNKDFKPAPFPETQKEREAAAKKYAMPADKYEPYPDDGLGYGDYPKLPNTSVDLRDPYYPYDYPEFRRNFNDPMHVETDLYSEDRYSTGKRLESDNVYIDLNLSNPSSFQPDNAIQCQHTGQSSSAS